MNETERLTVGAGLTLLLFLTPAFLLHTSPRFPGSLAGSILGIAAAILMLLLLVYPLAKYSTALKPLITKMVSVRSLLTFHVYAGVLGALLGILHTGHKYQSPLGIGLVVTMLIVVVTGFVGRYYLPQVSAELREQQSRLATLRSAFDQTAVALAGRQAASEGPPPHTPALPGVPILQLVDGIADLEYAIGSRDAVKAVFMRWIVVHVVSAVVMYVLLALHIAGQVYYGLRWLS
ncbi:iron reductase [Microvirga sp. Mcv34]|uniref:iron reductase n=1 Tax=Microvirga sp. Mcv34 TaxID=2926016 RepID=UPI0021CAD4E7|nr:iron reductase [Microvirga sp. Mcv34]